MKCPYSDCGRDYNDKWPNYAAGFVDPENLISIAAGIRKPGNLSSAQRELASRAFVETKMCKFCNRVFHEFYVGHETEDQYGKWHVKKEELVSSWPTSKIKFETKLVPKEISRAINEASRCYGVGSIIGSGACLRYAVYILCDEFVEGKEDYRDKIEKLPLSPTYKELAKQIKWIGDKATKPTGANFYTKENVELVLEVLPVLINELYKTDVNIEKANKILAKANNPQGKHPTSSP